LDEFWDNIYATSELWLGKEHFEALDTVFTKKNPEIERSSERSKNSIKTNQ